MDEKIKYICIEGNIGSGKTTLSRLLSEKLGAQLILEEFENNPYLPLFYKNPKENALHLEMSFLLDRYRQLQFLNINNIFQSVTISDYSLMKCLLFAKNNLRDFDFDLFHKLFDVIDNILPKPQLLIYLDVPIPQIQSNIRFRAREMEQNISKDYLADINNLYLNFVKTSNIPKLIIPMSRVNFLMNIELLDPIVDRIQRGNFSSSEILNVL